MLIDNLERIMNRLTRRLKYWQGESVIATIIKNYRS